MKINAHKITKRFFALAMSLCMIFTMMPMAAHAEEATTYTITYTDGVGGSVFADQVYTVEEGETIPYFTGTLDREGYIYDGWTPNLVYTVTADATYTAVWRVCEGHPTHSYYDSDTTNHWSVCGCGYTIPNTTAAHTLTWKYSEEGHWQECVCNYGADTIEQHSFESDADTTCDCGYTRTIEHTHSWSNYVSNGNGSHTRICTTDNSHHQTEDCGGTATCHTLAYCSDCQTSYGTYDATNHSGGTEIRNAKDATKTENGYTGDTYCVGCGDKLADGETIPATGGEDDDDTHTHNYRNEHDDTHHWKECSSCGDISDRGKHTPGVAATCHSLAECADCKMPYGDLDITNHKYLSYVEYEAGHRLLCVCGRLDDVAEMEPHIYTNDKDRSCNICGYERKIHAHRYTISTCTTAGVCSCGATTGVNPNNHTGGTEIRNAAEATIVAEGYTGDTYCLGCGSKIASGEVIPKAGVIFDGPGVEDVTFIPAAGTELPEDAVVIVEDHTPSADDLAFLALPETTDPSVRYAVVPEDWIGSMDAAVIGPDGGRYIRHEKLLINGKEYYVSGGDDGESLSLYDKEGNIYSYDGEKEPQVIGQNAGTEYPENKFIEINGAIYQIHSVQRDTDGNETLILYLDGKPAGMCQFDQYEEMNLIINIYNDDYHPAKVKASQQLSGYVGTVTTGENPIDGLESGKTYNVSVIGSQDISVPGAENVTGTITQTFAVPDALIGNKNVVYAAVHKTASGNEIGEVTLSEDGKTLTATYTVSSFSPFTVYAFVEADEPEIKTLSATIVDGSDDTTEPVVSADPVPKEGGYAWLWIVVAILAAGAAVTIVIYTKKKKK